MEAWDSTLGKQKAFVEICALVSVLLKARSYSTTNTLGPSQDTRSGRSCQAVRAVQSLPGCAPPQSFKLPRDGNNLRVPQPAPAFHSSEDSDRSHRTNQLISEALMISFQVVMHYEFVDSSPQCVFTEEDHSLQAVFLDTADESFRVGVQIG